MPRYFFHMSFGDRTCRDDEGVEFSNRAEARAEAFAVIHDLAQGRGEENGRGWAGWVLHVADAEGQFFSLPIDQPVLALEADQARAKSRTQRPVEGRLAELAARLLELRERTTSLLEQNQQLRHELASEFARGMQLRSVARGLVAGARSVAFDAGVGDMLTFLPRRGRPQLVLLQGGGGGTVKNS
jgi:hypothetical protein